MYEAIVTLAYVSGPNTDEWGEPFVATEVYRIEFETEADMRQALEDMTRYTKHLNKERLVANDYDH